MRKILALVFSLALTSVAFAQSTLLHYEPGPRLINGSQLNLMVDQVNGLTGNGTAGTLSATILKVGNGTVAAPSVTFTSDADSGIYRIGANNIGIGVNGAKVLDIGTAGLGVTGTLTSGAHTVTSASATCLAIGANGATNPVLTAVCSTASVATGLSVTGAAAASGLAVAVTSSGTDENLTFNAKGAGTITINGTATGNIVLGRAATGVSFSGTGLLTGRSATATPAAASAVAGVCMGSSSICIYWGTGTPHTALTAAKGSLFIATDGSSTSTRIFVNTDGSTAWAAVTTAS